MLISKRTVCTSGFWILTHHRFIPCYNLKGENIRFKYHRIYILYVVGTKNPLIFQEGSKRVLSVLQFHSDVVRDAWTSGLISA